MTTTKCRYERVEFTFKVSMKLKESDRAELFWKSSMGGLKILLPVMQFISLIFSKFR